MSNDIFSPYYFGQNVSLDSTAENAQKVLLEAKSKSRSYTETPIRKIIDVIARVGELWTPNGSYAKRALGILQEELSFSAQMIQATLDIIPSLCEKENLTKRIEAELGSVDLLDQFGPHMPFEGQVRAMPHGIVLHVAAGNVFVGCIDSLLNGFLTKNISLLKLSGKNQAFPMLFAESIREADLESVIADKFALLYWPYEQHEIENVFKKQVDAIIAWGGEDMIKSYRDGRGLQTRLIEHGPKISFQVISAAGFEAANLQKTTFGIIQDICMWDQAACSSSQNLFVQKGVPLEKLTGLLAQAFDAFSIQRGDISPDEWVEILKEDYRGQYSALVDGGMLLKGKDWMIHVDPHPNLRSSPLNRTLIIKTFENLNDLEKQISPYKNVMQTCGYLVNDSEKSEFLSRAATWGVTRFTALGQMTEGPLGAPHDGGYLLGELVHWVADEVKPKVSNLFDSRILQFAKDIVNTNSLYAKIYEGVEVKKFSDLIPVQSSQVFSAFKPVPNEALQGHIFLSGGTTGKPKTIFYSNREFDTVAELLGKGFKSQGIGPGTMCANLFVAGGLWSSFLAVDKALEKCGALQLPIGGQTEIAAIADYLAEFKPKVVLGLPSLLISLLNYTTDKGIGLEIPMLCYAGEHLAHSWRQALFEGWKTTKFFSAGYASVDGGPIGYQCPHCSEREHHLFSSHVHMELIEGEAVITSRVRRRDPIIHLRTGDMITWQSATACPCGSDEPKFILLGRCDRQINIWGARVYIDEIEQCFEELKIRPNIFQIVLEDVVEGHHTKERLTVFFEVENEISPTSVKDMQKIFATKLFEKNLDLRSHSSAAQIRDVVLTPCDRGTIKRSVRTGKVSLVKDLRK